MQNYVEKLKPNVGDVWRADELWLKIKGDVKYLFALMDDESRFCIGQDVADTNYMHDAQNLFQKGKQIMNKKPPILIIDGLRSYHDTFNNEFYSNIKPSTEYVDVSKSGDMIDNKMERLNDEIRDREKVMRNLKI